MLKEVNYEVKGQLAKLLATEDLIIENRNVSTASFDVERRVLTLPMWEKASTTVYDLLVGHEVGHALYTPAENWMLDYPEVPQSFVNVFEDVRIEKLMKQKYPGLTKTFYTGYSQLADQDFFGLEEHDEEDINLADRINIHYKIGNFTDISFESDEQIFVDRAFKTKTFQDVLELANDLTIFLKEQQQQQESLGELSFDEDGEMGGLMKAPQGGELTDKSPNSEGQGQPDVKDMTNEELIDELERLSESNDVGGVHGNLEAVTDKTLQDNLENLNKKTFGEHREPEYVELPDLNMKTVVAHNSEVHEYLNDHYSKSQKHFDQNSDTKPFDIYEKVDNEYRLFRRAAQKEVNYLVKEFEMRKSADAYARATVSKTGVLDCTKLHSYKYNEDLFKKITTLPDGKNHGLIFVLDWSGSMATVLKDTVKQLFNLIWFCKKVQIPFKVFAFTNEWNSDQAWIDGDYQYKRPVLPPHHDYADGRIKIDPQFAMVEFMSSDVKKGDIELQMINIWRLASSMMCYRNWHDTTYYQTPRRLTLSGTPLNEALVSLNQIIPEFQKSTGVQKVQCVTLTDGEAHPLQFNKWFKSNHEGYDDYMGTRSTMSGRVFIRDRKVGKTYSCKNDHHELTSALLEQLRGRFPDVNFIGIRVMDGRDANSFIRKYMDWDFDKVQHIQAGWKKNKSLKLVDVGYHAYFGLSSSALNNDSDFTVKVDATKSQIKAAFKKSLSAKKMNKKVLGEFMEYIA
jgi:hypothetical protein|tara:strand:- start:637 stop:2853 length:2217 start_codon:yes stop_codon:yes gene_type:complete